MKKSYLRILAIAMLMTFLLVTFCGCGGSGGNGTGAESSLSESFSGKFGGETTSDKTGDVTTEARPAPNRTEMDTPTLAAYVQERTVTITATLDNGTSTGSGFFIDDQGTVVTSYHVIDGAAEIDVEVSDGATYEVETIIDVDWVHDVAIIKIGVSGNPYLTRCTEEIRTGEDAFAVGSSLGFLDGTFSNGIISNASRTVGIIDCIQTTAAISHGNSGGPLVNVYGEVIGINAFSYTDGESLNLAVSMDNIDRLAQDKNWSINQYREWYKKEIDRSYFVFNYTDQAFEQSMINTYQQITGSDCLASAWDWDFEEMEEGYHENMGLYVYDYDVAALDQYTEYLNTIGFVFVESEDYSDGVSYFYENEFLGCALDLFISEGDDLLVIEPYS